LTFEDLLARVRAAPRDVPSAVELADQALQTQREEEAVPLLARAAQLVGNNPRLWQWTGLLHRALDDRLAALPMLDRAAALAPADTSILHGRARLAFEIGLPAVALYEVALRSAPGDGDMLLGHAAARLAAGAAAGAEAQLATLVRANPGWLSGHRDLSQLRWTMGARARFVDSYEEALRMMPRNSELWRALVIALMHAERYEQALAAIARARGLIAAEAFLDANEAVIYSETGDIAAADAAFARITGAREMTLALHHVRHTLRMGRLEEALAEIESWIGTPDMTAMWPYAASAWRLSGDPRLDWLEGAPALVGVFDIADRLPSMDRLRAVVGGLHRAKGAQLDQSVRGGVQTDGILLARAEPEIRALRAAIGDTISAHVAALPPDDPTHPTLRARRDRRPRLSGSWSVKLRGGGFHANHVHPAGWLSSAFYLSVPEASGEDGWLALGAPPAELGLPLGAFRTIEPRPGRLVLFPSTMWHGTLPFPSGERMTVAFDVQFPV
jgi:tetratricopeptide (TPR) repeat protein